METRAHYVAVGAFVLTMVFLAFVAVLWLAGTQFASSYSHYDIYFDGPVTGLSNGARVEYNGIPVGQVSDIEIVNDPKVLAENGHKPIRVTAEIKSSVEIKKDDAATLQSNILSGVSYVLIEPGKSTQLIEVQNGQRYPIIRSRRSTFASLAARGPQLLDKLDGILDHVDEVLDDQNRAAFATTLGNLQKISGSFAARSDEIADEASTTLKAASDLLTNLDTSYSSPHGLKDQLSTAFADFDRLVNGLSETNKQLSGTLVDLRPGLRTFSQHTLVDVDSLVGETRQFISGLSRLGSQIERDPTRLLFGDRREGYQPR